MCACMCRLTLTDRSPIHHNSMKERWSYFDQLDELEGVPVINIHLWCVR